MHTRELKIGQNTLRLETGKLAKQAHGSIIVRFGDSVVLVTACRAANAREGIDFLPLTVDYREYTYASGRIPGGFFKREGEAAEKEVSEAQCVQALETAHAAIKQIVATIDDLAKEAGKPKVTVQKKEIGHDFYREVEEKVYVPLTEAMRIRGKLENYDRVDQVLDDLVASIPEGEVQRK